MAINDPGKLVLLTIGLLGGLALCFTDQAALGTPIITLVLGYITGNGRLAVRKEPPSTALAPVLAKDKYVHMDELGVGDLRELQLDALRTRLIDKRKDGGK